jgi:phosphohistidine phosphatase SixA
MAQAQLLSHQMPELLVGKVLAVQSTATRSAQTMQFLTHGLANIEHRVHPQLYSCAADQLEAVLLDLNLEAEDSKFNTVILVGHNPAFSQVAAKLSNFKVHELGTCQGLVLSATFPPNGQSSQFAYLKSL